MWWRSLAVVVTVVLVPTPGRGEPLAPFPLHHARERHPRIILRSFPRPRGPGAHAPSLLMVPPGQFMPPDIGRSSPSEQLPSPPVSSGFHITLPLGPAPSGLRLDRAYDVGKALGGCWTPPAGMAWTIITIRLSFKRDGSINGEPRVPFSDAGSSQDKADLARSLLAALKNCVPLNLSPSLGAAIAGRIFAVSFTHQDRP